MRITSKPLQGMRILITRPEGQSELLSREITTLGGTPVEFPTIAIEAPSDAAELEKTAAVANNFDWLVFTSRNGVQHFLTAAKKVINLRGLSPRIAVIGPSTKSAVEQFGLKCSFMPSTYLTKSLAKELPEVGGKRILLVRAEGTDAEMASTLQERGALVREVHPYMVTARRSSRSPEAHDAILFTSPSTVSSFKEITRDNETDQNRKRIVCCIGPVTARAAKAQGFKVDVVADEHTAKGLLKALVYKVTSQ